MLKRKNLSTALSSLSDGIRSQDWRRENLDDLTVTPNSVIPAKAGIQGEAPCFLKQEENIARLMRERYRHRWGTPFYTLNWIPAFAGMTTCGG